MATKTEPRIYFDYGSHGLAGPLRAWERGDEFDIPERPPKFGRPRPGYRVKVTGVQPDGVAQFACVGCDGRRWVGEKNEREPCGACPGGGQPEPM